MGKRYVKFGDQALPAGPFKGTRLCVSPSYEFSGEEGVCITHPSNVIPYYGTGIKVVDARIVWERRTSLGTCDAVPYVVL
jgi:hypothetical protein